MVVDSESVVEVLIEATLGRVAVEHPSQCAVLSLGEREALRVLTTGAVIDVAHRRRGAPQIVAALHACCECAGVVAASDGGGTAAHPSAEDGRLAVARHAACIVTMAEHKASAVYASHKSSGILGTACHLPFVSAAVDVGCSVAYLVAHKASHKRFALNVVARACGKVQDVCAVDVAEDANAIGRGEREGKAVDSETLAVEGAAVAHRTGADRGEVVALHVDIGCQQGIQVALASVDEQREVAEVLSRCDEISAVGGSVDGACAERCQQ